MRHCGCCPRRRLVPSPSFRGWGLPPVNWLQRALPGTYSCMLYRAGKREGTDEQIQQTQGEETKGVAGR